MNTELLDRSICTTKFAGLAILIAAMAITYSESVNAGNFWCENSGGNPVCKYNGLLSSVYRNQGGQIRLSFQDSITKAEADSVGYTCIGEGAQLSAAQYQFSHNEGFANHLFATALSAHVAERRVSVWMSGNQCVGGYARIDRIWIRD